MDQSNPAKARTRLPRRVWAAALVLLALAAGSLLLWRKAKQTEQDRNLATQTAPVIRQDVMVRVTASGSVRPLTPVNISPKQPGRITQLLVDQGSRVAAGQVLARMDESNLMGQLLTAQGTLQGAMANLSKLEAGNRPQEIQQARENLADAQAQQIAIRSAYLSNEQLYGAGAIGRVAFDASRSQYLASSAHIQALKAQLSLLEAGYRQEDIQAARAQVLQARGALQTIQTLRDDTIIRAPFRGVITQKYADVGAFVTPTTSASATSSATSSSIFALAGELEGLANVGETDIHSIYAGQPVELAVDAFPNQTFQGKVRLIAPESVSVQNVTSFQVRITLVDPASRKLMSGMNFTASFLVGNHPDALLIPTPAITSKQGATGVFVLSKNKQPRFQRVRVGATAGTSTEVLAGLKEGERVFITFPGRRKANDKPVRSTSPFQQPGGGGGRQIR